MKRPALNTRFPRDKGLKPYIACRRQRDGARVRIHALVPCQELDSCPIGASKHGPVHDPFNRLLNTPSRCQVVEIPIFPRGEGSSLKLRNLRHRGEQSYS
jgi:hypothetical protein